MKRKIKYVSAQRNEEKKKNLIIGSTIHLNTNRLEQTDVTIVGTIESSLYFDSIDETIIFTIAGIGFGFLMGFLFSHAVAAALEIEKCRFINQLKPMSYLFSAALSFLFT